MDDDPMFKVKYQKYKFKVKMWEKNFRSKKGRIPSKHDIREASNDIRYAYKMYYKLKTSILEETLNDIFFEDDNDDFDVSNLSQSESNFSLNDTNFSTQISKLEKGDLMDGIEKLNDFEAEETNKINDKAWGNHLNVDKEESDKKIEVPVPKITRKVSLKPEMFETKTFAKRNPRKSLSKKSSLIGLEGRKSDQNETKEVLPDLETILAIKSQEYKNVMPLNHPGPSKIPKDFDDGWLSRCHSMNNINMNDFDKNIKASSSQYQLNGPEKESAELTNATSFGFSGLKLNKTLSIPTSLDNSYDGISDGIIGNSEDESTQTTHRHIRKRRRVMVSTENIPKIETNKQNNPTNQTNTDELNKLVVNESLKIIPNENIEPEKLNLKRKIIRKPRKKIEKIDDEQQQTNRKSPRSIKTRNNVESSTTANYSNDNSDTEDDPFKCDGDSDKDPEFKLTPESSPQKNTKKPRKATKSTKTPKRKSDTTTKKKIPTPKSKSPKIESNQDQKPNYIPEIDMIENVPRIKDDELIKSSKIFESYLNSEPIENSTNENLNENLERNKLQSKITAGKLNENFVRLNIKKKIFVRGKKAFNFSRYKKNLWKKKKAGALSGPDMDMGGCDGGILTCYNCNGAGHFAQNCPVKGDSLQEFNEEDLIEDSPFPTIDEVNDMIKPKIQSNDERFIGHRIPNEILKNSGILEMNSQIGNNSEIESLYPINDDGSLMSTPKEVYDALKLFGHDKFRSGQEKAVMRILSGKSTLVTLSTGSGKSLCYQLPAYLYGKNRKCCTLVISPLVSLMEDQVYGVPHFLNAQCLHTNQTPKAKEKIMTMIREGNLDVLLISPEAVISSENMHGFGSIFRELPPIAFACIDEAHCVSQWSHNFRPSYLMICQVLREKLKIKTILGLTATATQQTRESIITHLGIPDGIEGVISDIPLPNNLNLSVSRDSQRDRALIELLKSERFENCNSIIIYCTRRDECERVASIIRTSLQTARGIESINPKKRTRINWDAEPYHAGLAASRRKAIQNAFMNGNLRVVVATVAFGMGINKSDIRAVIHYNMPKNIESYVQEIGRAGRDNKPAQCHLFLDSRGTDQNELRRHIYTNSIDRHTIRKLLQKIFIRCACEKDEKTGRRCPGHEIAFSIEEMVATLDIPQENISTILCYLELHERAYIQILKKAYTKCKIISYGGAKSLRAAAKSCVPLAMAIALDLKNGISHEKSSTVEFPVVEIASLIGWDSGLVKHTLKNLEWTTENNLPKRSNISVQYFDLGFRIRAPGDLDDDELDGALDMIYDRVLTQEKTELIQLQHLYNALNSISISSCTLAFDEEKIINSSNKLKEIIREYFNSNLDMNIKLDELIDKTTDDIILSDVHTMISRYPDNTFTGRSIARIFHGCQSPNFPAVIWSRCKYWRGHLNTDFNRIVGLANAAIVKMRR